MATCELVKERFLIPGAQRDLLLLRAYPVKFFDRQHKTCAVDAISFEPRRDGGFRVLEVVEVEHCDMERPEPEQLLSVTKL
jgi:hypothetical protein